ncbi:NigD-like C-terminal domain-containing protein [Prevotella sp. KH2C16]|uniref:NigD1/NigD2 family lipoprotein n=1 Tax=Prevotella sp. KH2C16 TaxID=1855325 RepID=UPI0008E90B68|nr:NigD-like C-terminal domain-containing protein [Prevotella sp. KH2C16]SFG06073.1 NigD-like protein [Prevotella sp. KH2C16]
MKLLRLFLMVLPLFVSCSNEGYETGDGSYSYVRADFVEAHTVAKGEFDSAITDEDERLELNPHAIGEWALTADSTYRALLYYKKEEAVGQAVPVQIVQVLTVRYADTSRPDTLKTDPVTFQSLWKSKNGKYLNIGLYVKTGQDGEMRYGLQTLGIRKDSVVLAADGTRQVYISLTHNQNNVPQYYSSRAYLSLPLQGEDRSSAFHVTINTYKGRVEKDV